MIQSRFRVTGWAMMGMMARRFVLLLCIWGCDDGIEAPLEMPVITEDGALTALDGPFLGDRSVMDASRTQDASVNFDVQSMLVDAEFVELDAGSAPMDADSVEMDAGFGQDDAVGMDVDASVMEEDMDVRPPIDPIPTWVDCRLARGTDDVDGALIDLCDALHREPPEERIYGIRFVFMEDVGDVMDWIQPRLDAANRIFQPAGVTFITAGIVNVIGGEVQYLTGAQALSLGERLGDLRGHLDMPDASLDMLLEQLTNRLLESGADDDLVSGLDEDSVFTDQLFMRLMARAHPEDIYLAVGAVSEREGAGGQAPPPFHPIPILERSVVSVKPTTKTTVPAHELGHYFGLKHPHAGSQRGASTHLFAAARVANGYRARETHDLMTVLETHFGPELDGPLGRPFVPYDADDDEIADYEALRFALMDTWVRWRMSYTGEQIPFESYAQFMGAWRAGRTIGMSNYMYTENARQTNNCTWQMNERAYRCLYPERPNDLDGDAPLLDGYVLFEAGTISNVMSYIRIPVRGAPPTGFGLFQEQVDLVHISANAPQRLSLRNYAQGD